NSFRNRGLAQLLLHRYIIYLLLESKSICLFYSPYNTSASYIYNKIGFVLMENWKMIVGIDNDLLKINLSPVSNHFIHSFLDKI
ncbi:MAG: GNAT family N-acetyltransferase, partial [Nitrososphaeraceae archaeon]